MAELINSLKTFAYSGSVSYDRRYSSGQLRIIPLLNLGRSEDVAQDSGFSQWRDAMRMVARLPGGLPIQFRLKLWENLSEKYLKDKGIHWSRVLTKSATPNSRDNEISDQIHKDLHRTGCTGFSGAKQAKLRTVLTAYGRWNPDVGYCQGFNMIGAMLLEMTEGDETLTLKVLIYLIEGVLPQGYFSGGLRGLAVDMAVFRELLKLRKHRLHEQLTRLQGGEDQPPLIDVFTMHWFLTLFIHCLPTPSVLRIWDLVLLEGSEVLLRTALVLWATIEMRILDVTSADEFYSVMGTITREMLEVGLMDPNSLIKCVVSVGPFPFPGLEELRQKHRALVQQETPYKSFFLARRELDNLKKHYAAIRHRQKATTIILKGLDVSKIRVQGQRSNSLIPFSKKQTVPSSKPKLRRGSSGSKSSLVNNNNNKTSTSNLNNKTPTTVTTKPSNTVRNFNNGNPPSVKAKQGTTRTLSKTGKSFRRRRTLSASSVTSSSSSSTSLCDSSSDSSSSEGVWSDSDKQWVKHSLKKLGKSSEKFKSIDKLDKGPPSSSSHTSLQNSIKNEECEEEVCTSPTVDVDPPSPACSDPGGGLRSHLVKSSSIIDTNDSQHFLEEMKKLGKSDSFYENLSKRICELQFQNLKTLNSIRLDLDVESLKLPPFPKSPMPSPISPFFPALCLETTHLSPRGSISSTSAAESPLPKSLSEFSLQKQNNTLSRKTSKSSVSSVDLPDICIVDDNDEVVPKSQIVEDATEIFEDVQIATTVVGLPPSPSPSPKSPLNLDFRNCLVSPISVKVNNSDCNSLETTTKLDSGGGETTTIFPLISPIQPSACLIAQSSDERSVFGDLDDLQTFSPFPTTNCPCQFETEEDVNEVIRENIAILQRLKFSKTAYLDNGEDDCESDSYESASSNEDARDSGLPSSSKNSVTTTTTGISSVSSSSRVSPRRRVLRDRSLSVSSTGSKGSKTGHNNFNPFPTKRSPRLRVTKYGLYN